MKEVCHAQQKCFFLGQPFVLKDCALIAIGTGRKAHTLTELRDQIRDVTIESIYHHFWGGLLGARFEEREFNNDFAVWCPGICGNRPWRSSWL